MILKNVFAALIIVSVGFHSAILGMHPNIVLKKDVPVAQPKIPGWKKIAAKRKKHKHRSQDIKKSSENFWKKLFALFCVMNVIGDYTVKALSDMNNGTSKNNKFIDGGRQQSYKNSSLVIFDNEASIQNNPSVVQTNTPVSTQLTSFQSAAEKSSSQGLSVVHNLSISQHEPALAEKQLHCKLYQDYKVVCCIDDECGTFQAGTGNARCNSCTFERNSREVVCDETCTNDETERVVQAHCKTLKHEVDTTSAEKIVDEFVQVYGLDHLLKENNLQIIYDETQDAHASGFPALTITMGGNELPWNLKTVLAHEFGHIVQFYEAHKKLAEHFKGTKPNEKEFFMQIFKRENNQEIEADILGVLSLEKFCYLPWKRKENKIMIDEQLMKEASDLSIQSFIEKGFTWKGMKLRVYEHPASNVRYSILINTYKKYLTLKKYLIDRVLGVGTN